MKELGFSVDGRPSGSTTPLGSSPSSNKNKAPGSSKPKASILASNKKATTNDLFSSSSVGARGDNSTRRTSRGYNRMSAGDLSEVGECLSMEMARSMKGSQPTYQLGPQRTHSCPQLRKIASDTLELFLTDVKYSPDVCRQKTKEISKAINEQIKRLGISRYKLVSIVNIGSLSDHTTVQIASRGLWDEKTDKYVTAEYTNNTLYAVAMIYAIYAE